MADGANNLNVQFYHRLRTPPARETVLVCSEFSLKNSCGTGGFGWSIIIIMGSMPKLCRILVFFPVICKRLQISGWCLGKSCCYPQGVESSTLDLTFDTKCKKTSSFPFILSTEIGFHSSTKLCIFSGFFVSVQVPYSRLR